MGRIVFIDIHFPLLSDVQVTVKHEGISKETQRRFSSEVNKFVRKIKELNNNEKIPNKTKTKQSN